MVKRKDQSESIEGAARHLSEPHLSGRHPSEAGVDASGVVQAGQTDLELLRAGRIDVDEYVRRQAEAATAHLVGHVSAERLADLRELLAAQALHDPSLEAVLQGLNGRAAGLPV